MTIDRLPEPTQTLYAELLDQWALIEALLEDRPDDLRVAWSALAARNRPRKTIAAELRAAPGELPTSLLDSGLRFQ